MCCIRTWSWSLTLTLWLTLDLRLGLTLRQALTLWLALRLRLALTVRLALALRLALPLFQPLPLLLLLRFKHPIHHAKKVSGFGLEVRLQRFIAGAKFVGMPTEGRKQHVSNMFSESVTTPMRKWPSTYHLALSFLRFFTKSPPSRTVHLYANRTLMLHSQAPSSPATRDLMQSLFPQAQAGGSGKI